MNDNELTTLDAVEREIRARYNGKYQSALEYQASERETRKAITNIFRAVAEPCARSLICYIPKLLLICFITSSGLIPFSLHKFLAICSIPLLFPL